MVGDQVFADVVAGRLAGLRTILVRPTSPDEPWFTQLKRPFERQLLRCLTLPTLATLKTSAPTYCETKKISLANEMVP
jgi:predicted HAD superfamily phosphohydrolase YqeG